jgi:hypothetical protein
MKSALVTAEEERTLRLPFQYSVYAEPTGSRSFQRLSPECCIVKLRKVLNNRSNLKPSNVLYNRLTTRLSISFRRCNKAVNSLLYFCAAGTMQKSIHIPGFNTLVSTNLELARHQSTIYRQRKLWSLGISPDIGVQSL